MANKRKNGSDSRKRKILGILLVLLAVLIVISLGSHTAWDDQQLLSRDNPFRIDFQNQAGTAGAYSSYLLFFFFGWLSFFIPVGLVLLALHYFPGKWKRKITPALWFVLSAGILVTMILNVVLIRNEMGAVDFTNTHGGFVFYYLTRFLMKITGSAGSIALLGAGILAALVILGYSYTALTSKIAVPRILGPLNILKAIGRGLMSIILSLTELFRQRRERRKAEKAERCRQEEKDRAEKAAEMSVQSSIDSEDEIPGDETKPKKESNAAKSKVVLKKTAPPIGRVTEDYRFPGLELLLDNPEAGAMVNADELAMTAKALKETLETFGVNIDGPIDKYPGPVITRFEFKPAAGVKVNQITNLADDLALALRAKRIRIIAPIPGKAAVGVEIPNLKSQMVYLKEIIGSEVYSDNRLRLPLAFGKTTGGKPFIADLAKMPHLLIAGATGSGKSVCINILITSLLYRLHPNQIKFIFIDPKMLELSVYAGMPHLARPVVTNPKRAEKVLADAVIEMENRYKKLAAQSVRNIEDYNSRQKDPIEKMPYIVIIVDELADMMIAASSSRIEMLITRLAQMARAVGIHLILATQRPSVDVITGLIKANFSARIAFQVASKIDSRTILDANGAEKLLGNGDMLFLQPGQPEAIRLHGAFISGEETERLVKFIKDQFPAPEKIEGEKEESPEAESDEDEVDLDDPLFHEAAETVIRHKQGSVSLLQRKLGIGYQRAARLIDKLEEAGVVSAYDGSKAREVLVDRTYLEKLATSRSFTDKNR
ncbi:DNA translocase FtsK [Candidatus Zixiibacteriota bacterium]|nr:DNA translocase FtsK [candidate division Zixibacteria bacterium]